MKKSHKTYKCEKCGKKVKDIEDGFIARVLVYSGYKGYVEVGEDKDYDEEVKEIVKKLKSLSKSEMWEDESFFEKAYFLCKKCRDNFCRNPMGARE